MIKYIFPFRCVLCGIGVSSLGFCQGCWVQTEFISSPLCSVCGDPLEYWAKDALCNVCYAFPSPLVLHRSVWKYGASIKQLIFKFKHSHQIWLTEFFGHQMLRLLLEYCAQTTLIIPVPLHRKRLIQRGFNQALLLARWLSQHTGIPCDYTSLKRVKDTDSQGSKTASERYLNVEGAFQYTPQPFHFSEKVLLIDDVYTTGATLKACTNALKEKKVTTVWGITLSKVVIKEDRHLNSQIVMNHGGNKI
ncbi:ComF family protein [Holospora undulata]|uniref:Competence protein F n=1 Tax=Holospora undulata HU1 TaxID=1321371 RepID=A0A061JH38_9PROT|nr:ComF family protein [Holospora undulata]ETZ04518.1 competence protein F [Holospora undulata HU1]